MRRSESTPLTPTFGPTSGGLSGLIGIAVGVLVIVLALVHGVDSSEWPYLAGALFGIVACWAMLLRPRVVLEPEVVVLRNAVSDYRIPYARLTDFFVRSTTIAVVEGHKYIGIGVGRNRREMTRRPGQQAGPKGMFDRMLPAETARVRRPGEGATEADQLEDQVAERMRNALPSEDQGVRRRPALVEIGALVVTGAVLVLAIVL